MDALSAEMSRASAEQSASVAQVNSAVGSLDQMTQHNAALAEQSTAATQSLADQAGELEDAVAAFRLARDAGSAVEAPAAASPSPARSPRPELAAIS